MKILERFKRPLQKSDVEVVIDAAHTISRTPSGEILFNHLIERFELDDPSNCLGGSEANYRNGTQDVVKYILSLANEINTRSE